MASSSMEEENDLNAIVAWLGTFPHMEQCNLEDDPFRLLDDKQVAAALLSIADEICNDSRDETKADSCKDDYDTRALWKKISDVITAAMPQLLVKIMETDTFDSTEMRTFLLSSMLCFCVTEKCQNRHTYVQRITQLSTSVQQQIMEIIKRGDDSSQQPPPGSPSSERETPVKSGGGSGSKRNLDELKQSPSSGDEQSFSVHHNDNSFGSPSFSGYTPRRKSERLSPPSMFSPATMDSSLEKMVAELRKENKELKEERENSQQREADLNEKLQDSEVLLRKEMIKLEATFLQREEETRESHQKEVASLKKQVKDLSETKAAGERARQELAAVQDDLDVLEHTKQKLAEADKKVRIFRERLEQLGDVKEALTREEEAHAASVDKCLRLENELSALQPLKRQLEDYKARAIDAEVKLAECREDVKRMSQLTDTLNSAQKEILAGAKVHKEEADELRRRLLYEDEADAELGESMGDGVSELNPAIKEEMARLRNDNERLKAFAAKREDDAVQMLEERLDDSERLSDKYKEQFLSTKKLLESTQCNLKQSQAHVASLEKQVEEIAFQSEELGREFNECKSQLSETQSNLANTTQQLQESMSREVELRHNVEEWTAKAQEMESLSNHYLELFESTKAELEDATNFVCASQEREQQLLEEVSEWTEKMSTAETILSQCEEELVDTKKVLDEANKSLEASLDREDDLKDSVAELEMHKADLEAKVSHEIRSKEEALAAAEVQHQEKMQSLEETNRREQEELTIRLNLISEKERTEFEQKLSAASDAYTQLEETSADEKFKMQENYEQVLATTKREMEESLRQMEESNAQELASVKQAAADERKRLVEKGKGMLKDTKEKAAREIADKETELNRVKASFAKFRQDQEAYEKKAKGKISDYKQRLNNFRGRNNQLTQSNSDMEEKIKELAVEKKKLEEENERFRLQLGGRYGADGKVQNQIETLQTELAAVVEENRMLKKQNMSMGDTGMLSTISESAETGSVRPSYTSSGITGSALFQMRKEYEDNIAQLKDEKRELVMKNSAAFTEVQKAEQRTRESDEQVTKLKDEITSLKLALGRYEKDLDDEEEFEDDTKENPVDTMPTETGTRSKTVSEPSDNVLLDLSASGGHVAPLSQSAQANLLIDTSDSGISQTTNAYEWPSVLETKKKPAKKAPPPLLENGQPECKQS